jgi:ribulose 1,5-bisphosphate synthetase/thiazole synthase
MQAQGESIPFSHVPSFDVHVTRTLVHNPLGEWSSEITPENPLKVIIAGGGVGGLFLAKALQKQGIKVTILEKTSRFARFGGPIQVKFCTLRKSDTKVAASQ